MHLGKNLLYYTVAGTLFGAVLQWMGADWSIALVGSLMGPPLLLPIAIARSS